MKTKAWILLCMAATGWVACDLTDENPSLPIVEQVYEFEEGVEGWEGDFVDLPVEGQDIYDLEVAHAPLPDEIGSNSGSIKVQGNNRSDDLFMFLKTQISGLSPSTTYQIVFEIELASQYPSDAPGAGGSPGSSVYIKAGATAEEPLPVVEENAGVDYYRMNIDKGDQANEGADMINLGTVGIDSDEYRYELITRDNHDRPFSATTDDEGNLWLIVGTDSGFEGLTILYYNQIKVRLEQVRTL